MELYTKVHLKSFLARLSSQICILILIAERNPQHLCCGRFTASFFRGIQKQGALQTAPFKGRCPIVF